MQSRTDVLIVAQPFRERKLLLRFFLPARSYEQSSELIVGFPDGGFNRTAEGTSARFVQSFDERSCRRAIPGLQEIGGKHGQSV